MIWLGNAFWVLVTGCCALWTLFAKFHRVSDERSPISEVSDDETLQKPDDRNGVSGGTFRSSSGYEILPEEENSADSLNVSNALTSRYEFLTGNSFCGYIEEPLNTSFKVQELFLDSKFDQGRKTEESVACDVDDNCKSQGSVCTDPYLDDTHFEEGDDHAKEDGSESISSKDLQEVEDQAKSMVPDSGEPNLDVSICEEPFFSEDHEEVANQEKPEGFISEEPCLEKDSQQVDDEGESKQSVSSYDEEVKGDDDLNLSREDSIGGESGFSAKTLVSCEAASEEAISDDSEYVSQEPSFPSNDFWHTNGKFIADFGENYGFHMAGEVLAPETPVYHDTNNVDLHKEDVSGSDSSDSDDDQKEEECLEKPNEQDLEEKTEKSLKKDDEMDFDALLVHQLYVQKMKKELKHSRSLSLPTILEESESTRVVDDLKPLRINEKMAYKDRVDEIQNFYKSYLDKMRRLDIVCHQTLYAVGFLQLKSRDHQANNKKPSLTSIKTLAHNFLRSRVRRNESNPVMKLLRNRHRDLELVYVGQLCLSWEILKWQHAKAKELQLYDTMGVCRYGLVASELQQFQVLVQRFTEDEAFHGPRVENYVKSRFANSSLLQVPSIKDDSMNCGKKGEGRAAVSIVRLTDKIEESMQAFWEFVRADKKEAGKVVLADPSDAGMLSDMKADLAKLRMAGILHSFVSLMSISRAKGLVSHNLLISRDDKGMKERRLKDIVRSGNCLVKKFQKQRECGVSQEVVVAQVELRLVSRVMAMSRLTTDQLLWCRKKLGRISIVGRKVEVESSFLLFPC